MNILITGGAGFIGCNLAEHFLKKGSRVALIDNLSRPGTEQNLQWLKKNYQQTGRLTFIPGDVRDATIFDEPVQQAEVIFHLAAQVAVTSSITDPRTDFETNVGGTINLLEAIRKHCIDPIVFYTSTNKVYGGLPDVVVVEKKSRYEFRDFPYGIPEEHPLDFHSPYGCSKGAADQYVRDYARIYDLRSVVFRMSCQYGTRQFGNEDQGWVAHFVISALKGNQLTIFGNGKQVRDILYIDDLIRAFELALQHIDTTQGQIYNIGGGPQFTLSLLELIAYLGEQIGHSISIRFTDLRPGDQPVYVSDIRCAKKDFGWEPRISPQQGIDSLITWTRKNKHLFS